MESLPDDVWRTVALNLPAKDVLSFLSVNRRMHNGLGKSETFWKLLLKRDASPLAYSCSGLSNLRRTYMVNAHKNALSCVKWYPVARTRTVGASDREGHLSCVLKGPSPSGQRRIVLNGGFTNDETVHVINVGSAGDSTSTWSWERLQPVHRASYVYGASLTALEPLSSADGSNNNDGISVSRAVRFGGFRSGGYSNETNEVSILVLKEEERTEGGVQRLTADWHVIQPQNSTVATPRAYHSATLVAGRYLVLIGGMTRRGSILNEAVLDTQTWAYVEKTISVGDEKPSGRHGHSVILDSKRNRLVLFGGGNGTDLLRSGVDNAEVWELKLGASWQENFEESFPWVWNKLHSNVDATRIGDDDNESNGNDNIMEDSSSLSAAERLCFGRCHHGVKISMDMALLVFGSGRPSTNGMIGYNLPTETFVRPAVSGPLPRPRFTGISSFLEEDGYIFFHGGFCSQESDSMSDIDILDLAPGLGRAFHGLTVDPNRRSYRPITHVQSTTDPNREFHSMLSLLTEADEEARSSIAAQMLRRMNNGDATFSDPALRFMRMIVDGAVLFRDQNSSDESDGGLDDYNDHDHDDDDQNG